jgi:hypothetical protein
MLIHEFPKGEEALHLQELFCECHPYADDLTIVHNAMRTPHDDCYC